MAQYKIYIHGTTDKSGLGGFSIVLVDANKNNLSHFIGGGEGNSAQMLLKAQEHANTLAEPTRQEHEYTLVRPSEHPGIDKNSDLSRALADSAIVYLKSKFLKPDTIKKVKVSNVRRGNPF